MARRRKEVSFADRYEASNTRVGYAMAGFELTVQELDAATAEHDGLVAELAQQVNELTLLQAKADRAARDSERVADKIRGLIS